MGRRVLISLSGINHEEEDGSFPGGAEFPQLPSSLKLSSQFHKPRERGCCCCHQGSLTPTLTSTQVRAGTPLECQEPRLQAAKGSELRLGDLSLRSGVCPHSFRRDSASLTLPLLLARAAEVPRRSHRDLPSLVLNLVLRPSSPETFPFFPAKVALGQPDKLEAKVTHQKPVQSHTPRSRPR